MFGKSGRGGFAVARLRGLIETVHLDRAAVLSVGGVASYQN